MINKGFDSFRQPNLDTVVVGDDSGSGKPTTPPIPNPNTLRPRPRQEPVNLGATAIDQFSSFYRIEELRNNLLILVDSVYLEDPIKDKLIEIIPKLGVRPIRALFAILDPDRERPLLLIGTRDNLTPTFGKERPFATGLVLPTEDSKIKFYLTEKGTLFFTPTVGSNARVDSLRTPEKYDSEEAQSYIPSYIFPSLDSIWDYCKKNEAALPGFFTKLEKLFSIADGLLSCEDWVSKYPRLATGLEHRVSRLKNIMHS